MFFDVLENQTSDSERVVSNYNLKEYSPARLHDEDLNLIEARKKAT